MNLIGRVGDIAEVPGFGKRQRGTDDFGLGFKGVDDEECYGEEGVERNQDQMCIRDRIGLVSGFYPANRAVKISALTAIKQE